MSAAHICTEGAAQQFAGKFYWTGHPFVDAGLTAILLLSNKNRPEELTAEDIRNAINFASELYATGEWSSYIHGMIMPNNWALMANPSMSKRRSSDKISKNLWNILKAEPNEDVICAICGRNNAYTEREVYRAAFPLLGTGKMLNFFHAADQQGADICAHCIFLAQFMPLSAYRLPRVMVIHAYPYELMLLLSKEAIDDARRSKLASQARGFRRPENFLFRKIGEITERIERDEFWESASVTIYYFICNNQNQMLDVIHIPTPVLRFLAYASHVDAEGWRRIISMGWRKQSDEEEFIERTQKNDVYSRLLNGESILQYFVDRKSRQPNTDWNLIAFYCSEVMGLDRDMLGFVKDVGDRIVESIENLPDHKLDDEVRFLERAERLYHFEAFFLRVEKLRQRHGIESPLMTFDEFARILTAYGEDINISWKTVKNLLLFRIYERLHDRLMRKEVQDEEGIEEREEEEMEVEEYGGDVE